MVNIGDSVLFHIGCFVVDPIEDNIYFMKRIKYDKNINHLYAFDFPDIHFILEDRILVKLEYL